MYVSVFFRGYIYILYFTTIYIFLVKNKNPVPVIASILAIWLGMPCFAKQLHWSAWNFKLIDLIKIGHDVRYLWVVNSDIIVIATIQALGGNLHHCLGRVSFEFGEDKTDTASDKVSGVWGRCWGASPIEIETSEIHVEIHFSLGMVPKIYQLHPI